MSADLGGAPEAGGPEMGWKATSRSGVVAAGGAGAVAAGIAMLERGGNAADAAVATLLALNVTDHVFCSIGGEAPLLIYEARTGRVHALGGAGRAPMDREAIAWYMEHGIPTDGSIRMAPVPSALDLCTTALARFGTMSLEAVAGPMLGLLDAGTEPWHPRLARTMRRLIETERGTAGSREAKLQAASDRFYGRPGAPGDVADEIEAMWIEGGGFLRRADLAAHVTTVEEPVCVEYRGYTVCKCGPWTQGPFLCQALRLLEGFDLQAMGHLSPDYVHVVVEAAKLALADRDAYYGDPAFVGVPLGALLSDRYTAMRRPLIDMAKVSMEARPGDPYRMRALAEGPAVFRPGVGGTTTCVVADRWGNVVSATPSTNVTKQSDGGRAGVTVGNRMSSFNTAKGHPNCIAPGKRPRITLTPTLVLKGGKPVLAISVAGGDLQDQVALNLLLGYIEFGIGPEEAVRMPRFSTSHHQDSFTPHADRERAFVRAGSVIVSGNFPQALREELARRGHDVRQRDPLPLGDPVMIRIDAERGMLHAAGDPEARRHAAGVAAVSGMSCQPPVNTDRHG